MKFLRSMIGLLLLVGAARAATVSFIQTSVNDADGATIGAVASSQFLETGTAISTTAAPATFSSYRFTHWTVSSYPAASYRDGWGRSLNPSSFVLLEAVTATAHYLPATRDTDGDGVPDWYEMEYYGTLTHPASYDGDGDGISLLAESVAGTNPLYGNSSQEGGVAWADSGTVVVNLAGYASYTLRSVPAGTVNQSAVAPPGTVVTTPSLSANASFGYWTLDSVRQQDAWGVALPQVSFTMASVDREAVAYLFTGDTDADGVPDAYEQYYYGTLANGAASDTDGDGITLLAERSGGTNALYGNSSQEGGVAWADSALVTVNLAGFSRYTLSSVPAGTVNQSEIVAGGTAVTTPNMTQSSFGYWQLDGVRQQDAWGVALRQFTFTMSGADRAGVAYLFSSDTDGDGINDGFEQYHYGTLANGAASDTDGDGVTLLAEYTGGTNPLYGNSSQEGGVAWADSGTVVVNLQPILTAPISNAATGNPVTVAFTLLRVAQAGSVTLTFDDGVTPRVLTLAGAQASSGAHSFTFDPANPTASAAVASGPVIPDGTYVVTLSYLDTQLNAVLNAASVGVVVSATNPSTIELWRQTYFGNATVDTGNDEDFNHNGISNLLEFAFGTNPVTSTAAALLYNGTLAGGGTITATGQPNMVFESIPTGVDFRALFVRRNDYVAAGLTYTVQFSPDLGAWTPSAALPTVLANNGTHQIVSVPFPGFLNGKKARFFRVQVTIFP